jgi:fucose 4-O-acetylase-like acetyltransferase
VQTIPKPAAQRADPAHVARPSALSPPARDADHDRVTATLPTPATARDLAAATPADRDRYLDLLRVVSIAVVVVGHWLMAAVTWDGGRVDARNLLEVVPSVRPATWLLQVMPVFFLVGGYANARSWASTVANGGSYPEFLTRRTDRLLRPLGPFLVAWVLLALAVAPTRPGSEAVRLALLIAVQPLWFLAIYLLVVALTPPMLALHQRYAAVVPVSLVAVTALVDVLRLTWDVPYVDYLNYGAVWLFAHQLGFFYRDGGLQRLRRPVLVAAAAAGLAALAILTTLGPYPVSMVGLPGDRISNIAPPSICIVALTVFLTAVVLLARPSATRWVHKDRPWRLTIAANTVVMTVFVWQLTVLVAAVAAASTLGLPSPPVASPAWWATRPLWVAGLGLMLFAVVLVTGRFETSATRPGKAASPGSTLVAAVAAAYLVLGLAGLATCGLSGLVGTHTKPLLQLTVGPLLSVVHVGVGAALVRARCRRLVTLVGLVLLALAGLGAADATPLGLGAANAVTHAATAVVLLVVAWRPRASRSGRRPRLA